jgi:quercetin dioxygenase-like cupin family protein
VSAARPGPAPLRDLLAAVASLDARASPSDPAVRAELARVWARLRRLPEPRAGPTGCDHPVLRHLPQAVAAAQGDAATAAAALGRVATHLPWRYGYPSREDAPDLAERIAFAEVVGPGAPIESDVLCLGVTLIAPRTLYPDHRHPAIELYRILAGTATWTAGEAAHRAPPGALVLHPSGVVHAMRTHDEPLLAVYSWTGEDVRTPSVYAQCPARSPTP